MSWEPWLTYDGIASSENVTVPTLMIGSEKQFLTDGAKAAFSNIKNENKRALWLDEYEHDQFYDNPQTIEKAVEELSKHFRENL
jgi:pimeloyl-ACP methyl ester carboxylesterase